MNFKKGSSIIIISIIIALVLFIAVGSVGGYFVYKYYFSEDEEKDDSKKDDNKNDDDLGSSIKPKKDAEGFIDCGTSINDEESFDDPFWEIDFNKDEAMVCIGENAKNKCEKAKAIVPIGEINLTYKIVGTSQPNCQSRFEGLDYKGDFIWIECPISKLVSFINTQALNNFVFKELKEKMDSNYGNFAASIFTTMAMVLSEEFGTLEEFGCTGVGF